MGELRARGVVVGYVMLTVQDWATQRGHLWWKRLEESQTLPELHVHLPARGLAEGAAGLPLSWFAHDADEANRIYEACFEVRRLEWDGGTYEVVWLVEPSAAQIRDAWFWEPDEE
ncbi:hypothetical protein [Terrabacter carboxydivorans]|uniref:hypothetical protein n=1 Tax=Terrabacter carboxydivorans TaxID=619730 RepID=UPI0031D41FF4